MVVVSEIIILNTGSELFLSKQAGEPISYHVTRHTPLCFLSQSHALSTLVC